MSCSGSDEIVICPYNKLHRMHRRRLMAHILKCRAQHPDVELRTCPFNALHLFPEAEFEQHVVNCIDRRIIENYAEVIPDEDARDRQSPVSCDENWDDTDVIDFNPAKTIESKKVIRMPQGRTKSERKAFRLREEKRLTELRRSDPSDFSDEDPKPIKVERSERMKTPPPPMNCGDEWHNQNPDSSTKIEQRSLKRSPDHQANQTSERHHSPSSPSALKQRRHHSPHCDPAQKYRPSWMRFENNPPLKSGKRSRSRSTSPGCSNQSSRKYNDAPPQGLSREYRNNRRAWETNYDPSAARKSPTNYNRRFSPPREFERSYHEPMRDTFAPYAQDSAPSRYFRGRGAYRRGGRGFY